ncbi:MAG: AAC(3) family N-acetyltransferase [Anaerolineae bacterium]|nr:AAC(3) family N-acetyltransferase [Anaerolineae bacterium]
MGLTKLELVQALRGLGLVRGAVVEVHSSLSRMGHVEGGAQTVIEALMEVVGEEGAIVMPAHRVTPPLPLTETEKARGIVAKVRFLPEEDRSRSGMGVVADTFRLTPGAVLGSDIHRVCAWGRDASLHAQQGFAHLLSMDGWVLLIGVDITRCSSMHTAESRVTLPAEITAAQRVPEEIRREYPENEWYIQYEDPLRPPPGEPWLKVREEAERRGWIRRGMIGHAPSMLFKGKPVVDLYEQYLRSDPFGFFGIARRQVNDA